MNIKKILLSLSAVALATHTTIASAELDREFLKSNFYVGVDAGKSNLRFTERFGANIFKRNPTELSVFMGTKLGDFWGIEIGHAEQLKNKKDNVTIYEGEFMPGQPAPLGHNFYFRFNTTFKAKHPYAGFFFDLPLSSSNFSFKSLFGISFSEIKAKYEISGDNGLDPYDLANFEDARRNFKQTKRVPIIKLSGSYKFNDTIAINAFGLWRNLHKFNDIKSKERPNAPLTLKLSDSYTFGFGLSISPF